jgi:hypothetical protein
LRFHFGAPVSDPARYGSVHHRAGSETGAPIHACAINCRNTKGKMPPSW